jgi:hypothetical protein
MGSCADLLLDDDVLRVDAQEWSVLAILEGHGQSVVGISADSSVQRASNVLDVEAGIHGGWGTSQMAVLDDRAAINVVQQAQGGDLLPFAGASGVLGVFHDSHIDEGGGHRSVLIGDGSVQVDAGADIEATCRIDGLTTLGGIDRGDGHAVAEGLTIAGGLPVELGLVWDASRWRGGSCQARGHH